MFETNPATEHAIETFKNNGGVNFIALSGTITQLTQFDTSKGNTMSLGSIEGVGNRGKVIIEFTSFIEPELFEAAHEASVSLLLIGDLKLFKDKRSGQWKNQIDVSQVVPDINVEDAMRNKEQEAD